MVEYNIVKYCKSCRKRFVVNKSESKQYFCNKCQLIVNKGQMIHEEEK